MHAFYSPARWSSHHRTFCRARVQNHRDTW
jgi:hypothetical protein